VEYAGRPRMKWSPGKMVYPGRKQVWRSYENGRMAGDMVGQHDESMPGQPLLEHVMHKGKRLPAGSVPLGDSRRRAQEQQQCLPERLRALKVSATPYSVQISAALQKDAASLRRAAEDSHQDT
jgi:nicotinate phosphoribosyltransferase